MIIREDFKSSPSPKQRIGQTEKGLASSRPRGTIARENWVARDAHSPFCPVLFPPSTLITARPSPPPAGGTFTQNNHPTRFLSPAIFLVITRLGFFFIHPIPFLPLVIFTSSPFNFTHEGQIPTRYAAVQREKKCNQGDNLLGSRWKLRRMEDSVHNDFS